MKRKRILKFDKAAYGHSGTCLWDYSWYTISDSHINEIIVKTIKNLTQHGKKITFCGFHSDTWNERCTIAVKCDKDTFREFVLDFIEVIGSKAQNIKW